MVGLHSDETVVAGAPPSIVASMELKVVGSFSADSKEVDEAFELCTKGLVRVSKTILVHDKESC